jgi:DNA-binding winged helix-turn-helix (wHTH) protein
LKQARSCAALEETMATPYAEPSSSMSVPASLGFRLAPRTLPYVSAGWASPRIVQMGTARTREMQEEVVEFRFGPFRLLPQSRTLLRSEEAVDCGSRAFDLLHVLLLSRGKVVSKEDMIRHVWPTTCVEESNLRFQMASLRKALGSYRDAIKTVPGRGYLLASEWREVAPAEA